ncbi:MAG: acyl carrier protein [Ruminococcus sp.]
MTHEEIMAKLNEIFQDVFDDDSLVITDQTTANDIDDWDSLEHINLIEAVEKEFGMKFRMQEVSSMKNVGEMAEIVAARATGEPKKKKRGFFHR